MTIAKPCAAALVGLACVRVWAQTKPVMPNIQTSPIPTAPTIDASKRVSLSIDDAVTVALRQSPLLAQVKAGLLGARGRTQSVEVGQNPNLTLSESFTRQDTFVGPTATTATGGGAIGFSGSITAKQLLYDFGRTRSLVDQARLAEAATIRSFEQSISDVALTIRLAYLNVDDAKRTVQVSESNVRSRELDLRLAQGRLKAGIGQPADVVRATTNYDDALQTLSTSQSNLLAQQIQLANLIGIDPRTTIDLKAPQLAPADPADLNGYVDQALKSRADLESIRQSVKSARASILAAQKASAPSLTANATLGGRGDSDPLGTQTISGGVTLSFPLGDGGAASAQVKQAKALESQFQAQLKQLEQSVLSEVSTAWVQWQTNRQRLKVLEAEVANAEEAVRLAQGRYREGVGTFLEVTDAQATLVSARLNFVGAVSNIERARIQIRHGVGEPVPYQAN